MNFKSALQCNRNSDTGYGYEVVPAGMTGSFGIATWKSVHLRVDTDSASTFPERELGAPSGLKPQIVRCDVEALRLHVRGKCVVSVSGTTTSNLRSIRIKEVGGSPFLEHQLRMVCRVPSERWRIMRIHVLRLELTVNLQAELP